MHKAIKKVTSDIEEMKFNTAVSTFMTMTNEFYKLKRINKAEYKTFLQLLNPFAPHMTEELFEKIGAEDTIANTPWPTYDEAKTIDEEIKIPQSKYDKLKEDYLKNPKTAYSLYAKFNKEYPMDKKVFIEIIDKIRIDEGATAFNPIKKTKRANNPFSYYDKHPDSYVCMEYSK